MASDAPVLTRTPPGAVSAGVPAGRDAPRPIRFDPPAPMAWSQAWRRGVRRHGLLLVAAAGLVGHGIAGGGVVWVLAGVSLAGVSVVRTLRDEPRADRHRRMLAHHARGQWDAVRVLATAVGGRGDRISFDADVRLAAMAARDGGLDPGLRRIAAWRGRTPGGAGAYESAIGEVCLMAGETTGHVAAKVRAHEAEPGQPALAVEAALAHARFGEPDRAEALLASVDVARLVPADAARARWAAGLVALRRGSADAEVLLAQAADRMADASSDPAAWPHLAACAADHAIALHQAGRSEAARRRISDVWPVLEVHATVPLLRMLEADGLLPARARPSP